MNNEIQSVINDAFLVNGIKLEVDDPLVAVLVMQHHFFNETVNKLLDQTTAERAAFLTDFKAKANEVIAAVEKAEILRKEMLLEVLQSNEDTIAGIEERVQGSVSARLKAHERQIPEQGKAWYDYVINYVVITIFSIVGISGVVVFFYGFVWLVRHFFFE